MIPRKAPAAVRELVLGKSLQGQISRIETTLDFREI
jgi:hypothetical protein